jgi:putative DNA methylase
MGLFGMYWHLSACAHFFVRDVLAPTHYADALAVYLALGVSKAADYNSSLVTWINQRDQARNTFPKQALPMVWDFCEVNPFAGAAGDPTISLQGIAKAVEARTWLSAGCAKQHDALTSVNGVPQPLVSTDPPYYDNIGYADLSDYFYVWLRNSLRVLDLKLFGSITTPKERELVATPYRFGGDKDKAQRFFEEGLVRVFAHMRHSHHAGFPLTIFYAFKQSEDEDADNQSLIEDEANQMLRSSTGWETFLAGLLSAGFEIRGTWPMRTERATRSVSLGTNALASSIVLVC